jgi:hypothetical protein
VVIWIVLVIGALFVAVPHVYEALHPPSTFGDHYVTGELRMLRYARRAADGELVNDGSYTLYYQDGQPELEGEYVDGVRQGLWRWFYEDGTPKAQCRYVDGEGPYTAWYENGQLLLQGQLDGEKRVGEWTEYARSGEKAIQGAYVDDTQHGWWTYWREGDPEPAFRIRWDHGQRVEG